LRAFQVKIRSNHQKPQQHVLSMVVDSHEAAPWRETTGHHMRQKSNLNGEKKKRDFINFSFETCNCMRLFLTTPSSEELNHVQHQLIALPLLTNQIFLAEKEKGDDCILYLRSTRKSYFQNTQSIFSLEV